MAEIIEDGRGSGSRAKVDIKGNLHTDSTTFSRGERASYEGEAFNVNTGTITLTSASKSAVFYMKNNQEYPMVIDTVFYLIGNSTGGVGDMLISIIRNPTTGTIVSGAVNCEMHGVNRNFGSSNTVETSLIYKGAEANTLTNGVKFIESIFNQSPTRAAIAVGAIIIPKGSSIAVEITPATGNTSLNIQVGLSMFLELE